jgi:hypothetical protein
LVAAIPALFSVALMALFVFLVFGVVGIQLWSGVMRGECGQAGSGIPCALPCSGPLCQSTYGDSCPTGYVPLMQLWAWVGRRGLCACVCV